MLDETFEELFDRSDSSCFVDYDDEMPDETFEIIYPNQEDQV